MARAAADDQKPNERCSPMKEVKSPSQTESSSDNRTKQYEEPAEVYINLCTGMVCCDGMEDLPNSATPDPHVSIRTERLSGVSAKPQGIGTQK